MSVIDIGRNAAHHLTGSEGSEKLYIGMFIVRIFPGI